MRITVQCVKTLLVGLVLICRAIMGRFGTTASHLAHHRGLFIVCHRLWWITINRHKNNLNLPQLDGPPGLDPGTDRL